MFARLIRRDLADLNAVHSGQFVSNFLYDATLMRDASPRASPPSSWKLVQLVVYLAYVLISDWQLGAAGPDRAARRGLGDGAAGRLDAPRRHPRHARDRRSVGGAVRSHGRTAHHQGLWPGSPQHRAGGCAAEDAAEDPAQGGARCAPPPRRSPISFWAWWWRWCCSSPAGRHLHGQLTLERLCRLSRRPAAGAAAGAQSLPALAHRLGRHRRGRPHVRRHRRAAPPSSTARAPSR